MFGLNLKRKERRIGGGQRVTARLNSRLMPIDRGEIYEDPLDAAVKRAELGEVTGGGTQLGENGEAAFCDIELTLYERSPENLDKVAKALEACGAPKGSKLHLDGSVCEVEFGVNEGLALYLDGLGLPDEVYEKCDFDTVVEKLTEALGDKGRYHGFWQGERETAVYLYGPSFETMKKAAAPFLASYPLCRGARVEQIA
ncbi:MAG: hypothetical protein AB7P23_09260 [Amphiplicatus sp.]